jgi:hypothetical protein
MEKAAAMGSIHNAFAIPYTLQYVPVAIRRCLGDRVPPGAIDERRQRAAPQQHVDALAPPERARHVQRRVAVRVGLIHIGRQSAVVAIEQEPRELGVPVVEDGAVQRER